MARQLAFDLPANVRLEAQDFFVSRANELAYALLQTPATWPDHKLALVGPAGSGKTHLARVFAEQTGATILNAGDITPDTPMPIDPLVIEDGDALAIANEEWLFHAHNALRRDNHALLLTGKTPPSRWGITLPDLASRLSAATSVTIENPDDALLTAVLLKHFADRQLAPTPDAIAYLIKHLPRAFDTVRNIVETLDREALAQSKPLSRPFVRAVLDTLHQDEG
ncbi:HdaA/DnaA family protein [Octadecabacter ascidiaceicola]|uniref:Chromosomal replication initiator protein DnaA n=1 Tax=Octadecabacter ascidiaceicola TaxID=1655543 RepID=A0A238JQX8_9RHOB|nr:DnaA/Hda family protein [Octadecabacter ascidiaceicola]SMX33061.1 Chromosomal replication initiator protein DnaA [Octadecabacter ascidiaceicola]